MTCSIARVVTALACLLTFQAVAAAATQDVPVPHSLQKALKKIEVTVDPDTARPGESVRWKLHLDLAEGYHAYPIDEKASLSPTKFRFLNPADVPPDAPPADVAPVDKPREIGVPKTIVQEGKPETVYEGSVTWEQTLRVAPQAATGNRPIRVKLSGQVCDEHGCLPLAGLKLETPFTITGDRAAPTPSAPAPSAASAPPSGIGDYRAAMDEIRENLVFDQGGGGNAATVNTTLLTFLLNGFFWGAVSLVTPCVFPMIPITVSYFLKQSEKEHHRPLTMATVYSGTIVVVLTLAAVLLLSFFRRLSINPLMNFGLGALFVFFALSLFGMYEIELPSGLARFTSAREGRGGLVGTMFMALTFTIISFACVAPFLGGFAGTAATAGFHWWELVLGGLAFSVTFASPFFVLALFPTLLRRMPKSGSWLNGVKVVMGFLELAAALKFLRMAELLFSSNAPTFFTYDLVLGLYVALSVLCGLYLLGVYRLPHDSPVEHLSVPRLLFSLAFLGLGLYLLPGLFQSGTEGDRQRPAGTVYAWVDAFLLPEPREAKTGDLVWTADLRQALADARKQSASGVKRSVFLNFTGMS